MKKPNILMLITHDTGRHVSPYGIETVQTPNCERLASEGVTFENSWCTAPQCSPSRAALVTGRYPHANGVMGLTHRDFKWELHATERPIAKLLKEQGYKTWLLGIQHETRDRNTLGFDMSVQFAPILESADHLRSTLDVWSGDRPFYCQMGCTETHRPFVRPNMDPDDSLGVFVPPYLHDGPETREELGHFQGLVRQFDDGLGRILDVLDERGLSENTIVVVTTDHGMALPRAKGTLFDAGIETFLFMRWPERWPAGERRSELISNVDILPTLLEAAGAAPPENLHGRSFLPLLEGRDYAPRKYIWGEKTFHGVYDPMRGIRTNRHKYVRYFERSTIHRVPGDIMGNGADRELGVLRRDELEELYDLQEDPLETHNLAKTPEHQKLMDDMRSQMLHIMETTGDPLLHGPVSSPYYRRSIEELRQRRTAGA